MLHSAKNRSIYYINKFHVRNDYFVIDNNEPILDFLSYGNTQKGLKSVSTYDFSTLYTMYIIHLSTYSIEGKSSYVCRKII